MKLRSLFCLVLTLVAVSALLLASDAPAIPAAKPGSFEAVIDRVTLSEDRFNDNVRQYVPVIETYIQNLKEDKELGAVPSSDQYFLGRLDFDESKDASMLSQPGFMKRILGKLTSVYQLRYLPMGFAQMVFVDDRGLDRAHYDFQFVRREFLGELRCLVIDVQPKRNSGVGRFLGRIWVEDQDYNIVRFNGTFAPAPRFNSYYLHFDTWRMNMQPGLWLPAYVYTEESEPRHGLGHALRFKGQTRLWGYNLRNPNKESEFTTMTVDAADAVTDQSGPAQDLSPVQAQRAWERQGEDNVLARLEKAGLLAPSGEVDKVLDTVVNNLEITNNVNIQPPVRARVLLTTPLETFTVGHTPSLSAAGCSTCCQMRRRSPWFSPMTCRIWR